MFKKLISLFTVLLFSVPVFAADWAAAPTNIPETRLFSVQSNDRIVGMVCSLDKNKPGCSFFVTDKDCGENGQPTAVVANSIRQFGVIPAVCVQSDFYPNTMLRFLRVPNAFADQMKKQEDVVVAVPENVGEDMALVRYPFSDFPLDELQRVYGTGA